MKIATFGRIAVSTLLIAAPLGVAFAADMPVKAPPAPPPPAYSWTGFYIGVNGGGAQGNTQYEFTFLPLPGTPLSNADHQASGGMFGGTVGFNWQFTPHWVAGIEADWDWAQINGSTACPNPFFSCDSKIKDIGTARGRFGWAEGGVLFYATGGAAWGEVRIQDVNLTGVSPPSGTPTNGTTSTRLGWTAGGGIEAAIMNSPVSVKLEVLYYDFGPAHFNVDVPTIYFINARENGTMVRAGLNWRFPVAMH